MTVQQYEIIISRRHELVSVPSLTIHELSRLCECQLSVAKRLLAVGLIDPLSAGATPLFDRSAVARARKALRLKRDLGLNFDAVALVMELLDRIDELERRLRG
jgi:chaperone modulatory protein CbpM